MKIAAHQRFSVAMLLYVCTLFSALTFGFHQSQMVGQHLGNTDALFCGNPIPGFDLAAELSDSTSGDFQPGCPLCSSMGHGTALTALEWSLDYLPANPGSPPLRTMASTRSPRLTWPALNPRASPVASYATDLPA
ncbi:MAG: DUF2946 family protein [Pseudomonadaceae bacterium]|tara:strand:+ start:7416 stop:7820 length:405 start_codon:yes stop_codon:yes gene_type:complete